MKIPRILHQTWKDNNIPEEFDRLARSWKRNHTHWEYMFWTDDMNRDFIKEHFPYFLPIYDNYETNIERVDAVRYFVLYKCGGFYIDMDFECLANIEPVVSDTACVFGKEPAEHCNWHSKDLIISNAFMGAVPGFHFFDSLCRELQRCRQLTDHPNTRVLESTGPFMLSRMYTTYEKKGEISVLDADLLYPLTQDELSKNLTGFQKETIQAKLQKAYGIHHYAGTWWKNKQ